jgi:hypothetical protein
MLTESKIPKDFAGKDLTNALESPTLKLAEISKRNFDLELREAQMFHRSFAAALFAAALIVLSTDGARAASITLYNTGVNNSNVLLPEGTSPDPHYSVTPNSPSYVRVSPLPGAPTPWIPHNPGDLSRWISPTNVDESPLVGSWFVYTTTFDLTGLDPATALIQGRWAADNAAYISINGVATGTLTNFTQNASGNAIPFRYSSDGKFSFEKWAPFSIGSNFQSGINTLEFHVFNGWPLDVNPVGPTGLRVEMTGTADVSDVPEPATASLIVISLAGIAGYKVRRRKQAAAA